MSSQPRFAKKWVGCLGGLIVTVGIGVAIAPQITIQGVPLTIVLKFLADQPSRDAYFANDKRALHDRLQMLNIENEIKAYYRPQFEDEQQLDQHIHQVFYDISGYVGKSYVVTSQGELRLRNFHFQSWARLARRANLIADHYYGDDGFPYVVDATGNVARYETIASLYPKAWIRKQIKLQKRTR